MTYEEAKDQFAQKQNFKNWTDYQAFMFHTKVSIEKAELARKGVAELYARSKWEQACEAMRIKIIDSWQPDAGEFDSINDTELPQYQP